MRYSRFSNRFEGLVSGHRFIRHRVSLSKEHVTRITSQSSWDSGCTHVCSISLVLGVLHRCTPFSANSHPSWGRVPIPPLPLVEF